MDRPHLFAFKPLSPMRATLGDYSLSRLRADLPAAVTVAAVEIPQAIAYATIAGVPPAYGLYASIIIGPVAAMLSSSNHLATGPTNTHSLLIASVVARIAGVGGSEYLALVVGLTLLKGIIQIAFAALRLGGFARYVSQSVVIGLAAGAGGLIAVGQLAPLLGLPKAPVSGLPGILSPITHVLAHLPDARLLPLSVGLGTFVVVVAATLAGLRIGPLLGLVLAGIVVAAMGWTPDALPQLGAIPASLPLPSWPALGWSQLDNLLPGALALAMLGMIETITIGRSSTGRLGTTPIDPDRECFAQGVANVIGSFFSALAGTGSFTRTMLDVQAGAATRLAMVYAGVIVLATMLLAAPLAAYVPVASFSGVLLVIAWSLIDFKAIAALVRGSKSDAAVCLATIAATLLLPLEYAVFVGILLNLALFIHQSSRINLQQIVETPKGGGFEEQALRDTHGRDRILVVQIDGQLYFPVADDLASQLATILRGDVPVVILRMKRTFAIDATAAGVLEGFVRAMRDQQRHVIVSGARPGLYTQLKRFGLVDAVGTDRVFPARPGIFTSTRQALELARRLIPVSVDIAPAEDDEPEECLTYEI